MDVFIIVCGYDYSESKIQQAFSSLYKAKHYCKDNYGLDETQWVYSSDKTQDYYFYDGELRENTSYSFYKDNKHIYDYFYIVHRSVE